MPHDGEPTTILFWNIRAGGGTSRAQPILLELLSHQPDVIALAECRATFAGQLAAALRDQGLTHVVRAEVGARTNHIIILSRTPLTATHAQPSPRLIHATIRGLTLTACHIPDASDRSSRLDLFSQVRHAASVNRDRPHLMLGDFNANRFDHPHRDGTNIGRLAALGYVDLWLHQGGPPTDPTWVGPRDAEARIDHAYASKPLVSWVERMSHIHAPREQGLSDHSLLKLRVIHNTL